jgi:hypothetical protein
MGRLLTWVAGALGAAGAVILFRRRRRRASEHADPAEELRRRLDATRGEPSESAPVEEQVELAPDDAESHRRAVHERGRSALDEMAGPAEQD